MRKTGTNLLTLNALIASVLLQGQSSAFAKILTEAMQKAAAKVKENILSTSRLSACNLRAISIFMVIKILKMVDIVYICLL